MRALKRLLFGLLLAVALVVIAGVVFVANINPNDYKPQLSAAVKDATGYDVAIGGDISLSGFPLTHLEVAGVTVMNNGEAFAQAELINIRVSLVPLLRGRVESGGVTVSGLLSLIHI